MVSSFLDRAIIFAVQAHQGQLRKGSRIPYIVHPLEAVAIVATITSDQQILAAAALHDIVEDTQITLDDIRCQFGDRVAELVRYETMPPHLPGDTWRSRKQGTLDRLAAAPLDAKYVAIGDKLSNLRAIHRDYQLLGDTLWLRFHAPAGRDDISWYYHALATVLAPLQDYPPYQEYLTLLQATF